MQLKRLIETYRQENVVLILLLLYGRSQQSQKQMGDTLGSEEEGERCAVTNEQFYSFIAANSQGINTLGKRAAGQSPDAALINGTL